MTMLKNLFPLLLLLSINVAHSFSINHRQCFRNQDISNIQERQPFQSNKPTVLFNSPEKGPQKSKYASESEARGAIIFGLVMAVNIWFFTIPTELRRGHWCFTDKCAANRSRCNDCQTVSEWSRDVKDYYSGGGGIQFDFSIEEKD